MAITVIQHNAETGMTGIRETVKIFKTISLEDVQGLADKKNARS